MTEMIERIIKMLVDNPEEIAIKQVGNAISRVLFLSRSQTD